MTATPNLRASLLLLLSSACSTGDGRPGQVTSLTQAAEASRWVLVEGFPSGTPYSSYGLASRNLRIYLPEDYWANPTETYRVLYMHDGQNLFFADESFAGEWQVDETYDELRDANPPAIEKCIFVGIWNTAARNNEYATQTAQAAAYRDLIIHSIKPYIDANFRTKPEPQYTGIAGSSLGGLVSSWIAWNDPEIFGMAGNVSPSYWYESTAFYDTLMVYGGAKKPIREWHYAGSLEGSNMALYATNVQGKLLALGWTTDDAQLMITQGGQHNEYYWALQLDDMLRFLIPSEGGPSNDTTPPMITLGSPDADATVEGSVTFSASASDDVGVRKVEFFMDGARIGISMTPPYSISYDTRQKPNGAHAWYAKAFDTTNNTTTTETRSVVIDNAGFATQYGTMYLRGTLNGWGATAMTLVADYTWEVTVNLAGGLWQYKFEVGGGSTWSTSWGDDDGDGVAEPDGSNIVLSCGAGAATFRFNESTLAYTMTAPPPLAPPVPSSPSPSNGASGVSLKAGGSWSCAGAISYDVFFGTVNPPPAYQTETTATSSFGTMASGTTYYWRVVCKNAGGSTAGPVWRFTTGAVAPVTLVVHVNVTTARWPGAQIYYWSANNQEPSTSWPGRAMLYEGSGWYKFTFTRATQANIVFNDRLGSGTHQTVDLSRTGAVEGWFMPTAVTGGKWTGTWYGADTMDTDGDGTPNYNDLCPSDPTKVNPGVCGCDVSDLDSDGDAIPDCHDNCPAAANPGQEDADYDGLGDACDPSFDADHVAELIGAQAGASVELLAAAGIAGGNGLMAKLGGEGGVVRKVATAVSAFEAGRIDLVTYHDRLASALDVLDSFDGQLADKAAAGQIMEQERMTLAATSAEIREEIAHLVSWSF